MNVSETKMEALAIAKALLKSMQYVNVATSTPDGVPWNTPLYAVWTGELVCYWSSWISAEHSKNIRANSKMFMTMYDSTRARGSNNLRCLYIQGDAIELDDSNEIATAISLLYSDETISLEMFRGNSVKRIYKAIPRSVWVNDKSEREVGPETVKMRIELSLKELKDLMLSPQ